MGLNIVWLKYEIDILLIEGFFNNIYEDLQVRIFGECFLGLIKEIRVN